VSAFETSYRALNLDESDPVRLGHHLKQAETFMTSIVDVFGTQTNDPLPPEYIANIRTAVEALVEGLRDALNQAISVFVVVTYVWCLGSYCPKAKDQVCLKLR
jgi:hypothetical protein